MICLQCYGSPKEDEAYNARIHLTDHNAMVHLNSMKPMMLGYNYYLLTLKGMPTMLRITQIIGYSLQCYNSTAHAYYA